MFRNVFRYTISSFMPDLAPLGRRAVSFSKFDRAGKQTGRDFWLLNSPQRKLGINYY